jgi:hypothetical protein
MTRSATDSAPAIESTTKAQEPEQHHLYDDPKLGPMEFLRMVYSDPHTPLHIRMDAANKLMRINPDYRGPHLTIRVGGLKLQ